VPATGAPLLRAHPVGDRRAYTTPSAVEFEDGSWAVRATTDATIRLADDEPWLTGTQIAVGAVLAALALGGIWADHRSLQRRATTDALTRLPNRSEFERRANEVLARLRRDGGSACVMVVDLDRFKVVNDTAGHAAGDQALIAAAERLRAVVRSSDVVGRWGGDEFVVLLPGVADLRAVPERAATIAGAIAAVPPIGGYELTASVGAALFPAHGTSLDVLLRTADRAMYAAKVQGVPHHLAESGF
jgi:diguanylate cyclase (GGDEF)-like protein